MKLRLPGLLLLAFALPAHGAEPPEWTVRVELQMVALPMAEALQLVPRLRRPETFPAAEARVQALLAGGQAELLGWPIVQAVSGQKAVSESIEELRVGVEYGPPELPHIFLRPPDPPTLFSIFYPKHTPPLGVVSWNFGPLLEVEATVDAKTGIIDLSIAPCLKRVEALEPCIGARHQATSDRAQAMPRSSTVKKQTNLSLLNDGRVLLGTSVEQQLQPRVVLFLLHAVAQPPPAP
ncbi:MAG TPA: hypothetical protein VGO11_02405 [Chthoniobacteraceae bacterium]|jgi:hypothetical protein|nr:hypothetical protein [Chthoniobacteraceae bacterium]